MIHVTYTIDWNTTIITMTSIAIISSMWLSSFDRAQLYIDCIVVSHRLTKDLGVANVDERLMDFVSRSHRRLASATRHSIMLRSRSVVAGQTEG